MTGTAITPSRAEFIELAKLHTVVPVWTQILADLETPVAAFIKLSLYASTSGDSRTICVVVFGSAVAIFYPRAALRSSWCIKAYIFFAPAKRLPLPAPRTALAVMTNSPSESIAGMESEVCVPGPLI
jgi:hypothetical protein